MNHKKLLILGLAILLIASISLSSIPPGHSVGGLATSSFVQLDSNSQSQSDVTVTPLGTLTTGLTFRAGAVVTGAANPATGQVLSTDSHLKLNDTNNNIWDKGETVVYDTNLNNVYDPSSSNVEPIVAGITPATGSTLKTDAKIKFIDNNADGIWNAGETVVYDADNLNTFNTGDSLIAPAVFGWQFAINYDPAFLVPQADPSALCTGYPDCANAPGQPGGTVLLGSVGSVCPVYLAGGAVTGGCNWNSCASGCGSLAFTQPVPGKALVGFTYLAPKGAVFINTNVLLANVAFEIIKSGTTTISLSDLKFVDRNAAVIPGFGPGAITTDTITISNNPPTASFTTSQVSDPSCISGVPGTCIRFDGSASSDPEDITIAATNFFWDFGDGTQDLGATGAVVVHDYGAIGPGTYDASLRVVDSVLATGAARDSSGGVIRNSQPSHTDQNVNAVVTAAATTTTVSCTPASVAIGASTNCTATVMDTSSTPTTPAGSVTFSSSGTGTFSGSPCTMSGSGASATCSASFTPSGTSARTDTITGTYSGDSGHLGSENTFALTVTLGTHATSTAVSCTPSAVAPTQVVSCTATVTDTSATPTRPTGTITWSHSGTGSFSVGTCTLNGGTPSICTVQYTPTATGPHDISASYGGDPTHDVSATTTPTTITVTQDPTTTTVTCTPLAIAPDQIVSCTATVADTVTGRTPVPPTGTITWSHTGTGSFSVGTCALNGGTPSLCTVQYTPTAVGGHDITASYGGSAIHATSSTAAPTTITVTLDSTSTTVSCTPTAVAPTQVVSCTATVADTVTGRSPITPTGSVTFSHTNSGSFSIGSCALNGGVPSLCTVQYTPTLTGSHDITATYVPDAEHAASTTGTPSTITVTHDPTTITVSCPPNAVAPPQVVPCPATVADTVTGRLPVPPTGTVTWSNTGAGTFSTGTCTLNGGTPSICTVQYTPAATGPHGISATYNGDPIHAGSSTASPSTINVTQDPTTTTVLCTPTGPALNQPVTCTATVDDTVTGRSPVPPSGTVNWSHTNTGSFSNTSCTLNGGTPSICQVTYAPTASGSHEITASYQGSAIHAVSTSTPVTVTVGANPTSTTVNCTPSTLTIGDSTQCTATITDTATTGAVAPTGTVTFTPAGTCNLATGTGAISTCTATITPTTKGASVSISASYGGDGSHGTSQGSTTVTVNAAVHPTTTTVACNPSTIPFGISDEIATTCTATIVDASASPTTPTGSVTFTQTGIASGASFTGNPCTLVAGNPTPQTAQCSVNFSSTSIGTASITATYAGDNGHSGSDNAATPAIVTVTFHPTQTLVSCLTPIVPGASTDCNAIVDDILPIFHQPDPRTPPTGTVSWATSGSGSFTSLQCTLIVGQNNVQTSCTVIYTPAGTTLPFTDTVTATYSGDSTHSAGTPAATTITVDKRSTSTTVTCTPNSITTTTQTSSCTATINSDASPGTGITPTGTVTFSQIGISTGAAFTGSPCTLVPGTIPSSASCSVTFSSTITGTASITGAYDGDSTHAGSVTSQGFNVQVSATALDTTTTTVSCDTMIVVGQPSLCTATVTDTSTSGATTPTGDINWVLASGSQGTGSFDSNTCTLVAGSTGMTSCSVHFTGAGPGGDIVNIQATYRGDVTHQTSTSTVLSFGILGRSSTTTLTCTTPVFVNIPSTCNVTVTDTSPAPAVTPTGNFPLTTRGSGSFDHNCQLTGTGAVATCTVKYTPSATGKHTITAVLPVGGTFSYNTAGTFDITANPVPLSPTSTTISCNPTSVVVGQASICSATVTDTSITGAIIPTGQVTFTPGGPCTLQAATAPSATCSITVSPINLALNPLPITASYAGDSSHTGSTSNTVNLTVSARSTTTSITCVPSSVNTGTPTTCTVTVTDTDVGGFIPPLGQVTVSSSGTGTFIGSPCNLTGTSAASTCQVTYTPGGTSPRTDTLTANYAPATTHLTSSGTFQLSITQVALTGGHAKLIGYRAAPGFSIQNIQLDATQTLFAMGKNDGNITVKVYVLFNIKTPSGTSPVLYTQVVQLSPNQVINGRNDTRFSAQFKPMPGSYTVIATIYYSPSSATRGDPSFKPDNASTKTFTFTVLGARFNGDEALTFAHTFHATSTQTFNAQEVNRANIPLLTRIDITVTNPDGTISSFTSPSFLLNPSQNRKDISFNLRLSNQNGHYCFTATLKYGIDTNGNGVLDNNEILGHGKTVKGCFNVVPNDGLAQNSCDYEDDD